ncbi:MAG: DUF4890 domain-containing protein [Dysgonamonadaceae bacterium]|jgi:Spy/CpxP family protein refolding chaperone|nr:DUF4890 domain-containing protein [Dysgonamonadaceae bacterium]
MKALVRKSLVLVLVFVFVINVSAQNPNRKSRMTAEERAAKRTEMMTKQLDLTEDQQAKIKEINLKHFQERPNHQRQVREERRQNRENMRSQMTARDAELKEVLTPEQYEKWQEKKQETREDQAKGTKNSSKKANRFKK